MDVLVVWPPHVPSYFNAGHHLHLFTVAAYLRATVPGSRVRTLDAGALNLTWKDVADELYRGYDVVVVMNDYDALDGFTRLVTYARSLSPDARIVTCGRLSGQVPGFFQRQDLDGVVVTGDYEAGVAAFCEWVAGRRAAPLPGVAVRVAGEWVEPGGPGVALPGTDWVLPDITEIPYEAYDRLYRRDENKFCGIPERRELVVPVARGCPIGCEYCEVPVLQGRRERRLSVERTIRYIAESFAAAPFEYVSFYAPTFTLDRTWVLALCDALIGAGAPYAWKCATTIWHLDEALLRRMAASNCVRVSVGLETLDSGGFAELPRAKRIEHERFDTVARWCRDNGIELNCFVILGLPGVGADGARATVERVRAAGARVRPTIYTPYHEMRGDMTDRELSAFNRQLFVPGHVPDDAEAAYSLLFGFEPRPTRVMEKVPQRGRDALAAAGSGKD